MSQGHWLAVGERRYEWMELPFREDAVNLDEPSELEAFEKQRLPTLDAPRFSVAQTQDTAPFCGICDKRIYGYAPEYPISDDDGIWSWQHCHQDCADRLGEVMAKYQFDRVEGDNESDRADE